MNTPINNHELVCPICGTPLINDSNGNYKCPVCADEKKNKARIAENVTPNGYILVE